MDKSTCFDPADYGNHATHDCRGRRELRLEREAKNAGRPFTSRRPVLGPPAPPTVVAKVSSELRAGDIVHVYGHRLELVGEALVWNHDGPHGPAFTWHGEPRGTYSADADEWVAAWLRRDGYWTVQANDLVRWAVEVPA